MLSGLRAVADVLAADSGVKSAKQSLRKTPFRTENTPAAFFVKQNNPGYYKDNYGIIRTPAGKPLFTASEKYDVGIDGTIFEYDKPVGVIRMFDVASPIIAAEDALAFLLSPAHEKSSNLSGFRLFHSFYMKNTGEVNQLQ